VNEPGDERGRPSADEPASEQLKVNKTTASRNDIAPLAELSCVTNRVNVC